jgi:hypothetical protein
MANVFVGFAVIGKAFSVGFVLAEVGYPCVDVVLVKVLQPSTSSGTKLL